jgi:multiple sugar transport system permease protein
MRVAELTAPTRVERHRDSLARFIERRIAYVLILPTLLCIVLVNLYPLAYALIISFQENLISSRETPWVGLANYRTLVTDPETWDSIRISVVFTVASVAGSFLIGLLLALLLNRPLRGRAIIRSLFIIPWAIPAFVAALIWAWMFNDQFGILTALLRQAGVESPPIWLSRELALWSLILVMIWKSFPFQLVVLLAGLQAIPTELYEAAAVDGAGPWRRFLAITLPLLRPVAMVSVLLAAINAFHYFSIPWILTRGGPSKATNVIPIEAYNRAFLVGNFGEGSAAAVLMFGFILLASAVYLWFYVREVSQA